MQIHAELVGLSLDELKTLREETWCQRYQYEPWLGFREIPRRGKYVNISKQGFRKTGASENAKHTIFMFGGSTSFGYNVTDEQTISSFLQNRINDSYGTKVFRIENYGRGYYYSTQEYILLWQLLKCGRIPDVAIFLDYANEGQSNPFYTEEMRILFQRYQQRPNLRAFNEAKVLIGYAVRQLPLYRIVFGEPSDPPIRKGGQTPEKSVQEYAFNHSNIQSLCAQHDIPSFFFIGPVPGFRNTHKTHAFRDRPHPENIMKMMEQLSSLAKDDPSVTDLTGILENYQKPPFVDNIHYTPEACEMIAEEMFRTISQTLESILDSSL